MTMRNNHKCSIDSLILLFVAGMYRGMVITAAASFLYYIVSAIEATKKIQNRYIKLSTTSVLRNIEK